ncbi:hypothetical protein AGR3A_Cc280042 [Agrobacterium tomkonis CFBP 6623]|uniref:Uncharacterized protein n=1 Tax=Agrobacterium tomkonis CFBP 6623 TaxID=1183432 RepID=A0A1S7PPB4_9HYPH|nr:hypothetical protein AGR3A_Cc280042 [Agrobacterium tomkonis CFBP 6623]
MTVKGKGRSSKSSPLCANDSTVFQQWGENGREMSLPHSEYKVLEFVMGSTLFGYIDAAI